MAEPIIATISEEACVIAFQSPCTNLRLTSELLTKIKDTPPDPTFGTQHPGRHLMLTSGEARELRDHFQRAAVLLRTLGLYEDARLCVSAVGNIRHALSVAGEPKE